MLPNAPSTVPAKSKAQRANQSGLRGPASDFFKTERRDAVETANMSTQKFTPAMGRFAPTRFYDPVVALTRERLWRALAAMYVAPRPDDVIADVGCGTGSLAAR